MLCVLFSAETGAVVLSSAGIEAAFKALEAGPSLHGIAGGRLGVQASAVRFCAAAVGAFVCVSALAFTAGLRIKPAASVAAWPAGPVCASRRVGACDGVSALRRACEGVSALRRACEGVCCPQTCGPKACGPKACMRRQCWWHVPPSGNACVGLIVDLPCGVSSRYAFRRAVAGVV